MLLLFSSCMRFEIFDCTHAHTYCNLDRYFYNIDSDYQHIGTNYLCTSLLPIHYIPLSQMVDIIFSRKPGPTSQSHAPPRLGLNRPIDRHRDPNRHPSFKSHTLTFHRTIHHGHDIPTDQLGF